MIGKTVILEENTPVEVKLSADQKGAVTLGIRINGSDMCVMAQEVTMPEPGCSKSWTTNIKDLM